MQIEDWRSFLTDYSAELLMDPMLLDWAQVQPPADEDERGWWYEQGIRVTRSLVLNTRGDASRLLFDPHANRPSGELPFGTWASWNPAMDWTDASFSDYFRKGRPIFLEIRGSR